MLAWSGTPSGIAANPSLNCDKLSKQRCLYVGPSVSVPALPPGDCPGEVDVFMKERGRKKKIIFSKSSCCTRWSDYLIWDIFLWLWCVKQQLNNCVTSVRLSRCMLCLKWVIIGFKVSIFPDVTISFGRADIQDSSPSAPPKNWPKLWWVEQIYDKK